MLLKLIWRCNTALLGEVGLYAHAQLNNKQRSDRARRRLFWQHAVADVAAVGIPSEEWGETVGLAVVLNEGYDFSEEAICSFIRDHLRSSRVPESFCFTKELPYNETGKLLRRVIKEWF